jgi:OB-fold nucleic acid binding domain
LRQVIEKLLRMHQYSNSQSSMIVLVFAMFTLILSSIIRSTILRTTATPRLFAHAYVTTRADIKFVSRIRERSSVVQFVPPIHYRHPHEHLTVIGQATRLCSTLSSSEVDEINNKIKLKGDEIRQFKENGITKEELAPHIEELKRLKSQLPPASSPETTATPPTTGDIKNVAINKKVSAAKVKPKESTTTILSAKKGLEEMSETELRFTRVTKIDTMRNVGVEPYEYTYERTHTAIQLQHEYNNQLENGQEDVNANVSIAGRIMTRRVFGKLAFFTLQDATGLIQLQFDQSRLQNDSFQVCYFTCIVSFVLSCIMLLLLTICSFLIYIMTLAN